jgi:hypothetical protein
VKLKVDPDAAASEANLIATGEATVGKSTVNATSPAFSLAVQEIPGFTLSVEPQELTVSSGGKPGAALTAKVIRRGGFDGPIDLQWTYPNMKISAGQIEAGKSEARLPLKLSDGTAAGLLDVKLTATASIGGELRTREAGIKLTVTTSKPEGK